MNAAQRLQTTEISLKKLLAWNGNVRRTTRTSILKNSRPRSNPADEFEAFQRLTDVGLCVADIAARFGSTEAVVEKRLALARISPVLIQLYRDGQITTWRSSSLRSHR